jgi:hypothetical protein
LPLSGFPLQGGAVLQEDSGSSAAVGSREEAADRQVRKGIVEAAPGEAAVERTPNSKAGHGHDGVGIERRNGQIVDPVADDRLAVGRRPVNPRMAAILGTVYLKAEGVKAGIETVSRASSRVRLGQGGQRPRQEGILFGRFDAGSRLPAFKIRRLKERSGSGPDEEAGAVGGEPNPIDGTGGSGGQ